MGEGIDSGMHTWVLAPTAKGLVPQTVIHPLWSQSPSKVASRDPA